MQNSPSERSKHSETMNCRPQSVCTSHVLADIYSCSWTIHAHPSRASRRLPTDACTICTDGHILWNCRACRSILLRSSLPGWAGVFRQTHEQSVLTVIVASSNSLQVDSFVLIQAGASKRVLTDGPALKSLVDALGAKADEFKMMKVRHP